MKKAVSICLAVCLLLFSVPKADAAADDISGHFFEKEMRFLISEGILQGYGPGIYKPDGSITRAEFAAMVIRALELDSVESAGVSIAEDSELSYSDVNPTDWYYSVIQSAAKQGIVKGYPDGTFLPNIQISRQEMAIMIFRAIDSKGIISNPSELTFTDKAQIGPSFLDAVQRLVNLGIMGGNPDNTFAPLAQATRGQTAAVISRMLIKINPTLEKSFSVVEFNSDGSKRLISSYADFNTAKNNVNGSQAIMKGNSIVYIKNGIAVSNSVTNIFDGANLANPSRTYVSSGTELQYLDASENWVKISIGGKEGYVDPKNVNLTPASLIADRSSYKRVGSELYHTIYNPLTKVSNAVLLGEAPSFMVEGQKYYSWDGMNFTDANGTIAGQWTIFHRSLDLRTPSSYTGEELDRYLNDNYPEQYKKALAQFLMKEKGYSMEDAEAIASKSPLAGLGNRFKEMEAKYGVNALYLMAHAIHESAWGTSSIAQNKNNLYGIKATDSDPEGNASVYESFDACVERAAEFVSTGYLTPSSWKFNGAFLGNKGAGMNVKYASDPYWGEKIAGHMYRAQTYLEGLK